MLLSLRDTCKIHPTQGHYLCLATDGNKWLHVLPDRELDVYEESVKRKEFRPG